jgi:hypothetical protein
MRAIHRFRCPWYPSRVELVFVADEMPGFGSGMRPEVRMARYVETLERYRGGRSSCEEAAELLGVTARRPTYRTASVGCAPRWIPLSPSRSPGARRVRAAPLDRFIRLIMRALGSPEITGRYLTRGSYDRPRKTLRKIAAARCGLPDHGDFFDGIAVTAAVAASPREGPNAQMQSDDSAQAEAA